MESFSFDMNGIVLPKNQSSTGKNLTSSCVAIHTLFFLLNIFFQSWSVSPLPKKAPPATKRNRASVFAAVLLIAVCALGFFTSTLSPLRPCRFLGQPPPPALCLCHGTSTAGQDRPTDPILTPHQRTHLAAGNGSPAVGAGRIWSSINTVRLVTLHVCSPAPSAASEFPNIE